MHWKHRTAGTLVCVLLLCAAPAAFAQSSAQTGYSTPAGEVQQQIGHDSPSSHTAAAKSRGGGLPFTGMDVGLVGAAGALLLGAGFAARRLSRPVTS
jgi:hypothetical protein